MAKKIYYNETWSYSIMDDGEGYDIYKNDRRIITQPVPYNKRVVPDGTADQNAIAQIEELILGEQASEEASEIVDPENV